MQVTFTDDATSVMNTTMQTANKGPVSEALTQPVIGNDGWGGVLESGSLQWQVGPAGKSYIVWKDFGKESTRAMWEMDDETAVMTGLASIAEALEAENFAITLYSNGSYSVAS